MSKHANKRRAPNGNADEHETRPALGRDGYPLALQFDTSQPASAARNRQLVERRMRWLWSQRADVRLDNGHKIALPMPIVDALGGAAHGAAQAVIERALADLIWPDGPSDRTIIPFHERPPSRTYLVFEGLADLD